MSASVILDRILSASQRIALAGVLALCGAGIFSLSTPSNAEAGAKNRGIVGVSGHNNRYYRHGSHRSSHRAHRSHRGSAFRHSGAGNRSGVYLGYSNRGSTVAPRSGVRVVHPRKVSGGVYHPRYHSRRHTSVQRYGPGIRHAGRRHHRNHDYHYSNRRDRIYLDRERQRARYNARLHRQQNRRSNVRYETDYSNVDGALVITIGRGNHESASDLREANTCPRHHNCGERLYTDDTGPKLILLDPDQPGYEASDGPRVITYESIN